VAEDHCLKKATLAFIVMVATLVFIASIPLNIKGARASDGYVIDHVDQNLRLMHNGYVVMNDTVQLSGMVPDSFLLGFPYGFGSYVADCFAYGVNASSSGLPVSLNEPMEGRSGYYGIKIGLNGGPQVFSVVVLFSNGLVVQDGANASLYTVVFPEFPSLTQNVNIFNGSVSLPTGATIIKGTISNLTYSEQNLQAFAYNGSNLTFDMTDFGMQVFDIDELDRTIGIGGSGDVTASDVYHVTNEQAFSITQVQVQLPSGATGVSANDQVGRTMSTPTPVVANASLYALNFTLPIDVGRSTIFIVHYGLPSGTYVKKQGGSNSFVVNATLFKELDFYVNKTSVTFTIPEGARVQSVSDVLEGSVLVSKDVFQETVTVKKEGVTTFSGFGVEVDYEYGYFWAAFRPTTWIMVATMIIVLGFVIVSRPRVPSQIPVPTGLKAVRAEDLRSFVDMYEEKMKILNEMEVLESRAQKGRIPRQRYRVQSKTLETRLATSNRNLESLAGVIHSSGGHYSNLMDQLEVAEAQLREVEDNVKSIESRHNRGELSMEVYRRLQGDYEKRKERAQTSIRGILLRLREETR
jgi:hypothetical protein